MRLTQRRRLGFAVGAVFGQHQRSEGHGDDLLGLPAVGPSSGDLGQLHRTKQEEVSLVCVICIPIYLQNSLLSIDRRICSDADAKPKVEALDSPVDLRPDPHRWS